MVAGLFAAGGCAGYRLGSMPPPGVRSVHVPPFVNRCGEPNAEAPATRAAIQEFQKDGTLWVAPAEQADAILRVTLVEYRLDALRFDPDSGKRAKEYRVTLTAEYVLESARDRKAISSRRVSGETVFEFSGDLTSARTAVLPRAAQELAHRLVESVVDYW
jgi:hypothetical protein